MGTFFNYLLEFFFIVAGIQFSYAGYRALKDKTNKKNIGTAIFWFILGLLFIFWKWLSPVFSGILVVGLRAITLFNQFGNSNEYKEDIEKAEKAAKKHRNTVFTPVVVMAVSAIVISFLIPESSTTVIGIGAFLSLFVALLIFRPST